MGFAKKFSKLWKCDDIYLISIVFNIFCLLFVVTIGVGKHFVHEGAAEIQIVVEFRFEVEPKEQHSYP